VPAPAVVPVPEARDVGHTRRLVGLGISAVGVVVVGYASIATLGARSDYHQALTDHCRGETDMCNAEGLTRTHAALDTAHTQTIVAIVGGAAIAGGLVLYILAPRARRDERAMYVVLAVGADGGSVVFGGAF
jgi:serine/threonine-protein kinase